MENVNFECKTQNKHVLMLSRNFYFRRSKKYIPTFPDTKKIQTMDTFCFRKAITKYRSQSYNSIDYCPSSILSLGIDFTYFIL